MYSINIKEFSISYLQPFFLISLFLMQCIVGARIPKGGKSNSDKFHVDFGLRSWGNCLHISVEIIKALIKRMCLF